MLDVDPADLKVSPSANSRSHWSRPREMSEIIDPLPELLDFHDVLADRGVRAGLILQVSRRRKVIGMRMGVEDPLDRQLSRAAERQQSIGGTCPTDRTSRRNRAPDR